jgi:hypothetical protein
MSTNNLDLPQPEIPKMMNKSNGLSSFSIQFKIFSASLLNSYLLFKLPSRNLKSKIDV